MKEEKYLSKEYSNCIRGICAIIIVIHHLYQYTGSFRGTPIGTILSLSGALAVSVFFFYSGYGLMLSSTRKSYVRDFLRSRFLPLYCFYIILVLLYSIWTLCIEHRLPLNKFIQSFFFGGTIITNGWYLQVTFVLYLIYWFSFSCFTSTKTRLLVVTAAILIYCVVCHYIGLGAWWYQTIPCAVLGMVFCYKKAWIDGFFKKRCWVVLAVNTMAFGIFYILNSLYFNAPMLNFIYFLFFVCAVISLSYILCNTPIINNSFFALCGKYSFGIYVSHGLFLKLIKLNIITNKILYIFVVIVGTIIASVVMEKIHAGISLHFRKSST